MGEARTPGDGGRQPIVVAVTLPTGLGGSARSVVNLLCHLDGVVERVVVGPPGGTARDLVIERAAADTYLPYAGYGRLRSARRVVTALRTARWVGGHRRAVRVIHANGLGELTVAFPAALLFRVPLVVWVHQFALPRSILHLRWLWRGALRLTPVRWAAVSPLAADLVADAGLTHGDAVAIVPNPIDPDELVASERPSHRGVQVVYAGTPAAYKGFHHLPDIIEAVDRRLADSVPLRWLVFSRQNGDAMSGTWDRLRAMTHTHPVSIVGKTPDVAGIYARSDIVVCPSVQESFCRVAAEAMVNGIPVVASDLEPVRALLGDDEAGLLFSVGDVDAAADAVALLARDAELRRRLGAAGRKRVAAFAPERVRRQFLDIYSVGDRSLGATTEHGRVPK